MTSSATHRASRANGRAHTGEPRSRGAEGAASKKVSRKSLGSHRVRPIGARTRRISRNRRHPWPTRAPFTGSLGDRECLEMRNGYLGRSVGSRLFRSLLHTSLLAGSFVTVMG